LPLLFIRVEAVVVLLLIFPAPKLVPICLPSADLTRFRLTILVVFEYSPGAKTRPTDFLYFYFEEGFLPFLDDFSKD